MKPGIPQGTRDFSPEVVRKRQYIFNTLRTIFELYGFQPLETPAMENLTTLTGKYGEEGDRLIFKVLNNGLHETTGDKRAKLEEEWAKVLSKAYSSPVVTERALRYDLTIPFARYVVMNHNDLALPFRRYQMQPVWRADRPQRGRYREFWQCDADVVGSKSLINEAELLGIYTTAFAQLGIPVAVKVNSRKLLQGLSELAGHPDKMMDITIALDKLDKIGWDGVVSELETKGVDAESAAKIQPVLHITGTNTERLDALAALFAGSESGLAGIAEIRETLHYYQLLHTDQQANGSEIVVDVSLARGLNYYTGVIVEVVCTHPNVAMGSIGGGGRYDDLTGLFGLKGLSGVGVSFGIDRIYDVIEQLNGFPTQLTSGAQVLILNFGGDNEAYALAILKQLRADGIAAEVYPDAAKFDKQMKYANKRGVRYVLLPGDDERAAGAVSVKNFETGSQQLVPLGELKSVLG